MHKVNNVINKDDFGMGLQSLREYLEILIQLRLKWSTLRGHGGMYITSLITINYNLQPIEAYILTLMSFKFKKVES